MRHQLSWPMRIVGLIQIWRGCVIYILFFDRLHDNFFLPSFCPFFSTKIAWEGDKHANRQTLWLMDQFGPEGQVGENLYIFFLIYKKKNSVHGKQALWNDFFLTSVNADISQHHLTNRDFKFLYKKNYSTCFFLYYIFFLGFLIKFCFRKLLFGLTY